MQLRAAHAARDEVVDDAQAVDDAHDVVPVCSGVLGYCLMTMAVQVDAVMAAVAADALRTVTVTVLAAET